MKNGVRVEKSKKKITSCNYYVEYDRVKEGEAGGEGEKERERERTSWNKKNRNSSVSCTSLVIVEYLYIVFLV